ncbi:transglutaminase [Anopheles sinensis]|uniref:Transglutaminase n=1 Tax=Anopheles sinensis TaxID=74873 RepID=A0A084WFM8_ANOSI|nr:transglutaminase [Anopheles sinensis]
MDIPLERLTADGWMDGKMYYFGLSQSEFARRHKECHGAVEKWRKGGGVGECNSCVHKARARCGKTSGSGIRMLRARCEFPTGKRMLASGGRSSTSAFARNFIVREASERPEHPEAEP